MLLMARRWADRLNALRPQLPLSLPLHPPQDLGRVVIFLLASSSGYDTLTTSFALAIINLGEKNLNKV